MRYLRLESFGCKTEVSNTMSQIDIFAVCPPMAEAMVRANLPEWDRGKIDTMAQFHNAVAV